MKMLYAPFVGGLNLNNEAKIKYAALHGIALYVPAPYFRAYTMPKEVIDPLLIDLDKLKGSKHHSQRMNILEKLYRFEYNMQVNRYDPALIKIAEDMQGKITDYTDSIVQIIDLPANTRYRITEQDDTGREIFETPDSIEWEVAT